MILMKKITFPLLTLFLAPLLVGAVYYVSDYDPDYVPYNLQEVIDSREYDSCTEELKEFDETYESYLDLYGTPISVGDTLDVNFGALKEVYEEEFRQCLILLRTEMQEESVENCDFEVIDELNRDEERLYRDEIRTCEILRALESCDFTYIDEMDGSEKFKYRVEIDECEAALEPVVQEEPVVEFQEPEVPVPEIVVKQEPVSTPTYEPVYVPPAVTKPSPEPIVEEVSQEEVLPEPVASSSDVETFVMTQEEIDALVAERVAEESGSEEQIGQKEEPSPEEKPGFLKRIWNFLFGWLW